MRILSIFALASGIAAAVRFASGSGSLRLRDCSGPLHAKAGSDSVEAEGLSEPASVKTGLGAVRLAYRELPASGEIRVDAGSGAVSLALPAGSQARFSLRSGSGKVSNAFAQDPDAALRVAVKTGSGEVHVEGGK